VRIDSPKFLFFRIARCFDLTSSITENQNSQQPVVLNTELGRALVFKVLGIYHLEPFARAQL